MFIGGNLAGKTYYYDCTNQTFQEGPKLNFGRYGHASGTIKGIKISEHFF